MNVAIASVRPARAGEWDSIWEACEYATFFHSREWSEIWSVYSKGRWRPDPRWLTFSDGRQALLPLASRKQLQGLGRRYVSSPGGTFGGWISADALSAEHGEALVHWLTHKLGRLEWRLNPYDPLAHQLEVPVTTLDETHAVDLSPGFDALRCGGAKVKKALREGVTIGVAASEGDWRSYFGIYEESLRRWGEQASSQYRWELFDDIRRRESPRIKLWLARFQNRVIAGALCFYARRHAVYWHGAALEAHFQLRPVNLLMHEAIRDACERGCAWFDFNPSGAHEGVKAFKKSLGGQPLPCPIVKIETTWRRTTKAIAAFVKKRKSVARDGVR